MVTQVVILLWMAVTEFVSVSGSGAVYWIFFILVWISVLLTIISGGVYLKGYAKYIETK